MRSNGYIVAPTEPPPAPGPKVSPPRSILSGVLDEIRQTIADSDPRMMAWAAVQIVLPEFAFPRLRTQLFRLAGPDIRNGATVLGPVRIVGPPGAARNLRVGPRCVIGPRVTFGLDAPITLGRAVSISPGATLYTGTHDLGPGSRRMSRMVASRPIIVEDGVWIGMKALILPGVRLGRGSVVAAGAVVGEDVPPNTLVGGNPATVIRQLPMGDR
jgi:maltose O-acetyltransferase